MASYKIFMLEQGEKDWRTNGLIFPKHEQAERWISHLKHLLRLDQCEVRESDEVPNCEYTEDGRMRFLPGVATR